MLIDLTWNDVASMAARVSCDIGKLPAYVTSQLKAYPIPRGGVYAAQAIQRHCTIQLVENVDDADIIIDDLIDSGKTRDHYTCKYPVKPFFALLDKPAENISNWVTFPWERMGNEEGPEENIRRIIEFIGDDPTREGLLETPKRVVKSYAELFAGYKYKTMDDIAAVLKVFKDGACEDLVLLKNIEFVSYCEHHLLPFTGVAHIAYLPKGNVIGLSKLARVLDIYARRLQIQERLTQQITQTLDELLKPLGSACVIEAKHTCMCYRGVRKQNSVMVTSSITGEFKAPEVRAEFFSLIKG